MTTAVDPFFYFQPPHPVTAAKTMGRGSVMNKKKSEDDKISPHLKREDLKKEAPVVEYVNAAASSSSRARAVIIILIVATVLLAVEIRNTSFSWPDARLEVRKAALRFFDKDYAPQKVGLLAAKDPDLYRRATLFLRKRNYNPRSADDKAQLEKELDDYRKVAIEEVSFVHVPFFGAVFDHNDIGMFGGLTFTVLLIWLRYSLSRELSNLKLLFRSRVLRPDLRRCYELLAMQQVLTVPRLPRSTRRRWRTIPKVLYFFPPLVYCLQLYFDLTTIFGVGEQLGMEKAWLLAVSSSVFFILIIIFSVSCIQLLIAIDRVWDGAAVKIYPGLFPRMHRPQWLRLRARLRLLRKRRTKAEAMPEVKAETVAEVAPEVMAEDPDGQTVSASHSLNASG
jgi:hypothetical protein